MLNAWEAGTVIPAFNIPYLPMMEPVINGVRDTGAFALIAVARLEWVKFEAKGARAVYEEYQRLKDERHTRLHLDHIPVVDEDGLEVDFRSTLAEAIDMGYDSVMVDGSRVDLERNIAATREIVEMAGQKNVPVEAELGAVMGHEDGPLPPYEELFQSGKGFTDPEEARRFVGETGVNWLSVAIGNIHGAISKAARNREKIAAKLSIERLDSIRKAVNIPLVLHGGTNIRREYLKEAFQHGISKINIGTAIRKQYENSAAESVAKAQDAVYGTVVKLIKEEFALEGLAETLSAAG
jgi:ketose-bisphosphate aldolase